MAYTAVEPAAFAAGMQTRGVPELAIQRTLGFMTDIKHGQEAQVSSDLETALGRPPASLTEGIKRLYKL